MMITKSARAIAAAALALAAGTASGFGVGLVVPDSALLRRPRFAAPASSIRSSRKTALSAIRCEGKTYQLEEREDKDVWTTEVFLYENREVSFGQTDGAPYDAATGRWDVEEGTNDFKMFISRTFNTGNKNTDMGEFSFDVERIFVGEMTKVGESVAITGVIHTEWPPTGDDGDMEVGFFNMIDGTDERMSYEEKAQKLASN